MDKAQAKRNGQWLELDWSALGAAAPEAIDPQTDKEPAAMPANAQPRAGSHPHQVRQWLLARSLFPAKWINRLFSVGGIRWNGEQLQLLAYPRIEPRTDALYRQALNPTSAVAPQVLYEDDFCIVFDKGAGMPVHGSSPAQSGTLDEAAARHMLSKDDPLNVRHIHRLDDDTSGPVLYAKNDLAQWKLDEAMRVKAIDRQYIAVVHGQPVLQVGTITAAIGKDRHHAAKRRVSESGEHAVTHYEVIASNRKLSLLRVRLETGRTHQIRVHLSHIGHPLVGDGLYGGDARMLAHQALHGERLLFPHPWTDEQTAASSPWPQWLVQLAENIQTQAK